MKISWPIVILFTITLVSPIHGQSSTTPESQALLAQMGFDCCSHISSDKIPQLYPAQIDTSELRNRVLSTIERIISGDVVQGIKGDLVAIQGDEYQPDRFIYRHEDQIESTEIVIGQYSTTITIISSTNKTLFSNSPLKFADAYSIWAKKVFNLDFSLPSEYDVKEYEDFWVGVPVLYNPVDGKRRYIPWTWSESIKLALDKKGFWLSFNVNHNMQDKAVGPPKRSRGVSTRTGWFAQEKSR